MNVLVDDMGVVIAAMRGGVTFDASFDPTFKGKIPFYMYGHRLEIDQLLIAKAKGDDKYNKYPLAALRMDFTEEVSNGLIHYNLNMAFLHSTEKNYTTEQRYTNVFKPVLYPLVDSFFLQLKRAGFFQWEGDQYRPPHTKIDRPYYGTPQGTPINESGKKKVFTDTLDAIELVDLRISKRVKKC